MNQTRIYLLLLFILGSSSTLLSQAPMNWTRDEINPGEDFTLTPDDSFFTEGLKSLHLILNTGSVPYLVSDVFYITPGSEYEFSVDVFDNDTAGTIKVYADFYDAYGFNIFGQPPVMSQDSVDWQTISWQGTIPGQAVVGYILIKFYNQPDFYHFTKTAEAWIDKVQFIQAGFNLVANPGFEDWNVGIEDFDLDKQLKIYPNPAFDQVNIDFSGDTNEVIIFSLTGKQVYRNSVSGKEKLQINLQDLPDGIYVVEFQLNNERRLREKLIKL
jgi:hypothetical protein